MSNVHVIARHWARPESVEEVHQILLSLIEPSRAEPGCLKYELLQQIHNPGNFTFVETFANEEALKLHAASPYIAGLQSRLAGLTARPSEVLLYQGAG